jgi:hypothetical protein
MTGEQFKLLRKLNRITQQQIATHINHQYDRNVVYRAELQPFVPIPFVRALSECLKLDLTKPDVFERVCKDAGIALTTPDTPALDWRRILNHRAAAYPLSVLLERYRQFINTRVSRAQFQNIVVNALARGEIRPVGTGSGILYACCQFDSPELLPKPTEKE